MKPGNEQRLLAYAFVLVPCIEIALRLLGTNRTLALLGRAIPILPVADASTPEVIARCVRLAAKRGPYHLTCLRRSIAIWWLLKRRHIDCSIKIGAANGTAGFAAHAWVEWPGGQSDAPETLKHLTLLGELGQPGVQYPAS